MLDAQGPLCSPPQTWAALSMEFLRLWLGFLLPGGHKMYPSEKSMFKSHMAISSGCHRLPGFSNGTLDTLDRDREDGEGVRKGEVRSLVSRWLLGRAKPFRMLRWVLLQQASGGLPSFAQGWITQ